MTDIDSIIVSNIKFCMKELNNLVNRSRPKYPDNSEFKWELFKDAMKKTVISFRQFTQDVRSVEKLQSAKSSLDEADTWLKDWAGRNEVLYNPTRGDLLPVLLYCKKVIEYLRTHLPQNAEELQNVVNNSQDIQTELSKYKSSDLYNLNLMESVKSQSDIHTLLCQMKDLNDN